MNCSDNGFGDVRRLVPGSSWAESCRLGRADSSGHFLPSQESLQIGVDVFRSFGIGF